MFMGGPLTFNPRLIGVFKERLGLSDDQALIPDHPETMVARGAALSLSDLFAAEDASLCIEHARVALSELESSFEAQLPMRRCSRMRKRRPISRRAMESLRNAAALLVRVNSATRIARCACGSALIRAALRLSSPLSQTTARSLIVFYASNEGEPLAIAPRCPYRFARSIRFGGHSTRYRGRGRDWLRRRFVRERIFGRLPYGRDGRPCACPRARSFPMRASFSTLGGQDMRPCGSKTASCATSW